MLFLLLVALALPVHAQQPQPQPPRVILGPPVVYARPGQARAATRPVVIAGPSRVAQRGYGAALPRAAGFSYQAGYAPPAVAPNMTSATFANGYRVFPNFTSGPMMPYGSMVYGSTYPGYGFGFGTGYGMLGYNFNYPGMTVGYGYLGNWYPAAGYGYVAPTWYYQQMQGFYTR